MRLKASSGFPLAPEGRGADHSKMKKSEFAKFEISKYANRKNENLKTFVTIFPAGSITNGFPQDHILVPEFESKTFVLWLPGVLCFIAMCELQT